MFRGLFRSILNSLRIIQILNLYIEGIVVSPLFFKCRYKKFAFMSE